jgi:hypothetical protein
LANLERIIDGCRRIASRLKESGGEGLSGELQSVEGMEGELEGLREKFFMKTVAAVPATRKCLQALDEVSQAMDESGSGSEGNSWEALKKAIGSLMDAVEELVEKAGMRGITLT